METMLDVEKQPRSQMTPALVGHETEGKSLDLSAWSSDHTNGAAGDEIYSHTVAARLAGNNRRTEWGTRAISKAPQVGTR